MKELLFRLCNEAFIGNVRIAADVAKNELNTFCDKVYSDLTGSVYGTIKGDSDYTIMLEAHIDEIGFIVTNVDKDGFVRVNKVGGIDIRTLPSTPVIVHGTKKIRGVFTSTPPHLQKGDNKEFSDLDEIYIDTGKKDADRYIKNGDFVTFDIEPCELNNGYVTSKSLDDRSGCVAVIDAAKRLSKENLPVSIVVALLSGEELGNRGAKIGAFATNANEAIAVDVSFAASPGAPTHQCGECEKGAMLGISPILSNDVTNTLKKIADENGIKYQTEVMGSTTSTDADVITITKCGIPCGLLSIPLKYMHTPIETINIDDIRSVSDLMYHYVKDGGIYNA